MGPQGKSELPSYSLADVQTAPTGPGQLMAGSVSAGAGTGCTNRVEQWKYGAVEVWVAGSLEVYHNKPVAVPETSSVCSMITTLISYCVLFVFAPIDTEH